MLCDDVAATGATCRITRLVLAQDGDCCGGNDYQYLNIDIQDGGGGAFAVLSSERWAIDQDNLAALGRLLGHLIDLYDQAEERTHKNNGLSR